MIRHHFLLLFLLFTFLNTKGQNNLVPNYSFETGTPQCCYIGNNTMCTDPKDFDDDVYLWSRADPDPLFCCAILDLIPLFDDGCASPDYSDSTQCQSGLYALPYPPHPSKRFVQMYAVSGLCGDEGVRVGLKHNLEPGKQYKIKMQLAPLVGNANNQVHVHLTKFGKHWDANTSTSNNVAIRNAATFNIYLSSVNDPDYREWRQVSATFTVPKSKGHHLAHLIITMKDGEGGFWVDEVELLDLGYPSNCCADYKLYENTDNLPELTHTKNYIKAGEDVGIPNISGPVTVKNGQNVTFRAGDYIRLEPGFTAEAGSEFKAQIKDCSQLLVLSNNGDIEVPFLPNAFIACCNTNDYYLPVKGATYYEFYLYNRWGQNIVSRQGMINSNFQVIWDGYRDNGNCIQGGNNAVYAAALYLANCVNDTVIGYNITVFNCPQKTSEYTNNDSKPEAQLEEIHAHDTIPSSFHIEVYPNPVQSTGQIRYTLPRSSTLTLTVYNLQGKVVDRLLADKYHESGAYQQKLNASHLPPGVYYFSLQSADFKKTRKFVVIR